MSILEDQLIGSGNLEALDTNEKRNPFPKAPEWDGTPSVGFGGYTYANDTEQAELFGTTPKRRIGPKWRFFNGADESPRYGGAAGARPMKVWNTLLGQLSYLIRGRPWGGHWTSQQLKHSVMSSGEMKSLEDKSSTTVTGGSIPVASGGAFKGYDDDNKYGISNWYTDAQINVATNRDATTEELAAAVDKHGDMGASTLRTEGVNEVGGTELFRPTADITTGLRNLSK